MIRHNLDVMHIENNLLMYVLGKMNDHLKAPQDLAVLDIRSELHAMVSSILKASYTLKHHTLSHITMGQTLGCSVHIHTSNEIPWEGQNSYNG